MGRRAPTRSHDQARVLLVKNSLFVSLLVEVRADSRPLPFELHAPSNDGILFGHEFLSRTQQPEKPGLSSERCAVDCFLVFDAETALLQTILSSWPW